MLGVARSQRRLGKVIKHNLPNSTPQRGLENSDGLGEVANYANKWKLYHGSSYTLSYQLVYNVLWFAVKHKFMTLWLNTTI